MKYLCLAYIEEALMNTLKVDELHRLEDASEAFSRRLRDGGCLVAGERLLPTALATTVRPCPGGVSISDGPAASAQEQLSGFHLIHARDLNEAIRIASHIPVARYGCVEVRPVSVPSPTTTPRGDTPCAT